MSAKVTVDFCVPVGHKSGDYALFYGNSGSGDIDYVHPLLDGRRFYLFPLGAGIYGWGFAPWGQFPWGAAFSMRTAGWGYNRWGMFPWGYGAAVVSASVVVESCGSYKFAFGCFDVLDNPDEGEPQEIEVEVHAAPPVPAGLKKSSYNKDTDVLVLEVV